MKNPLPLLFLFILNGLYVQEMVQRLQKLKMNVTYTEYPGVNHNSKDHAFAEPTFLSWMFSHQGKKAKFKEHRAKK